MDLVEAYDAAEQRVPDETIHLPWGTDDGEVGTSADFGPCCIDVLPDGRVVIVDSYNLRVQVGQDDRWHTIYTFDPDQPPRPDGIAVLDSGSIAVATVPVGDSMAERTLLLLDTDGEVQTQGTALTELNDHWFGGEDVWVGHVGGLPDDWVRVTAGEQVIPLADQTVEPAYRSGDLVLSLGLDPDASPAEDTPGIVVDVEFGTSPYRWIISNWGEITGHPHPVLDERRIALVWLVDPTWLVTVIDDDGALSSFRTRRLSYRQTGATGFARLYDESLYMLQLGEDGASIERYDL